MNHQGTKTIQTERLTLRMLDLQDAKSLFEAGCLGSTEEEAEKIVLDMIKYYIMIPKNKTDKWVEIS